MRAFSRVQIALYHYVKCIVNDFFEPVLFLFKRKVVLQLHSVPDRARMDHALAQPASSIAHFSSVAEEEWHIIAFIGGLCAKIDRC